MEIKNVIGESIVCVKLFNIVNDFGKKKNYWAETNEWLIKNDSILHVLCQANVTLQNSGMRRPESPQTGLETGGRVLCY